MNERVFIITDTETTGLSAEKGAEIVQLAAICIDPVTLQEHHNGRFNMYVKPKRPELALDNPELMKIIKPSFDKAMAEGVDIKVALERYDKWTRKINPGKKALKLPLFAGFNVKFDWDMVSFYMLQEGVWDTLEDKPFANMLYDIWQTSFNLFESDPGLKLSNLNVMLERFNLKRDGTGHHDAMEDVLLTAQLFQRVQSFNRRCRTKIKVVSQAEASELMSKERINVPG